LWQTSSAGAERQGSSCHRLCGMRQLMQVASDQRSEAACMCCSLG
jgi:hypothetical protein